MDKIVSTRIEQDVAALWDRLARRKKRSKKSVLEEALKLYAKTLDEQPEAAALDESFGAWKRTESADETFAQLRAEQVEESARRSAT